MLDNIFWLAFLITLLCSPLYLTHLTHLVMYVSMGNRVGLMSNVIRRRDSKFWEGYRQGFHNSSSGRVGDRVSTIPSSGRVGDRVSIIPSSFFVAVRPFCAFWACLYIISGAGVVFGTPHPAV